MKILIAVIVLVFNVALAAINPIEFETEDQLVRYKYLIAELRCLVCQNQNLADSNAELALDLKKIVQQKILAGESDDQILKFMTDRYGDFVLYRPPFKSSTLLLWLGPLVFLMLGILIIVLYIKRNKKQSFQLSQQHEHVRKLLDSDK